MKNLLTFLLIILFSLNCVSQEAEKLPEIPWANIVEMNLTPDLDKTNWERDIFVKLQGFYTDEDSIIVSKAIEQLDSLTETISIQFSKYPRGNFEIFIMDSTWFLNGDYYVSSTSNPTAINRNPNSRSTTIRDRGRVYTQIYMIRGKTINYENELRNKIAQALVSGGLRWNEELKFSKNRHSIFNYSGEEDGNARQKELNKLDIEIIRETYKKGYKEKLELAKEQFRPQTLIFSWLKKFDPYIYLLFPMGVIIFILLPFYIRLTRNIQKQIRNKLIHFNISGIIGIIIITTIGFFYSILSKMFLGHFFQISVNLILGIFGFSLLFGLVTINLIRFVEIFIHRNTHLKRIKIVLIFISTALIPFIGFLAFYHVVSKADYSKDSIVALSYIFIGLLIIAGFRALISYFFFKEKDLILENETKLSQLRELKSKAELNALHSRINPHFLYNSLNSIAGLAHDDADKTEHMALSLSKLFRYSINKEKSDWTTFKEELEMVKIYLEVEKVRFDDRLTYSVEISAELEEQNIPRFIIQPLVENAVKHGISKSVAGGEIKVGITKEGKNTTIAVKDSGPAFPEDLIPGFGIQSIYDKLEILYKDRFEMNFTNSPEKQVTLKLK